MKGYVIVSLLKAFLIYFGSTWNKEVSEKDFLDLKYYDFFVRFVTCENVTKKTVSYFSLLVCSIQNYKSYNIFCLFLRDCDACNVNI